MADIDINSVINLIKNNNIGNLTEKEKSEYIDKILEVLSDEKNKLDSQHPHYPILTEDFLNESLFKILNNLIDLDLKNNTDGTEDYLDHLSTGQWNESVNELINILKNKILKKDAAIKTFNKNTDKEVSFTQNDIIEANAGNSFNNSSPYVIKNKNVDGDTYTDVRNTDKIDSVLNKRSRLQFTHSQTVDRPISDYIRLLMPKYTRRVEVEDLNRNFWVIGQTIAGISMYLFDDDSPMKKMFKYLSSEIVQLWENLIYLWALLKILSAKPKYDTKYLVVYLPNDNQNSQLKYDNFGNTIPSSNNIDAQMRSRLKYLVDEYSNCNLVILPIIREKNYYHNYYSQETYYGIWAYNRYNEQWTYISQTKNFNFNDYNKKYFYGARQNGDKLRYAIFNDIANLEDEDQSEMYFGAIRIQPLFKNTMDDITLIPEFTETSTQINIWIDFMVVDAINIAITGSAINDNIKNIKWKCVNNKITTSEYGGSTEKSSSEFQDKSFSEISKAYYLGEVISGTTKSKKKEEPIIIDTSGGFRVLNIGSFFPVNLESLVSPTITKFHLITEDTNKDRFNIITYGEGCYVIKGAIGKDNSLNAKLKFIKNQDIAENGSNISGINHKMKNREDIDQDTLTGWGVDYLEYLYNNKKIYNKPAVWVTKINLAYWRGSSGTVWNNGVICDLIAVFKKKPNDASFTIVPVCPIYMFDGYWTDNPYVFTSKKQPVKGNQWRRLHMKTKGETDFKVTITQIEGQDPKYSFSLENGKLIWEDNWKTNEPESARPQCNFRLNNDNNGNRIVFSDHNLGDYERYFGPSYPSSLMTTIFNKNGEEYELFTSPYQESTGINITKTNTGEGRRPATQYPDGNDYIFA